MNNLLKKIVFLAAVLLLPCLSPAAPADNGGVAAPATVAEAVVQAPNLAALGPSLSALNDLAERVESQLPKLFDFTAAERDLKVREKKFKNISARFDALKTSGQNDYAALSELLIALKPETESLKKLNESLSLSLSRIDESLRELNGEKEQWAKWKAAMPNGVPPAGAAPMFAEAEATIKRSQNFVFETSKPFLEFQGRVATVQSRYKSLTVQVQTMLENVRVDFFSKSVSPMFSREYFSRFGEELRTDLRKAFQGLSWPDRAFFSSQGWIAVFQLLASVLLFRSIQKKRELIEASPKWRFLAQRPWAFGFFAGVSVLTPLYGLTPPLWRLLLWTAVATAMTRLISVQITRPWKRFLVYVLAILFIIAQALRLFALPRPLFRLYVALIAAVGAPLCFWRASESAKRNDSFIYTQSLRLGGVVSTVVLAAQLGGYNALSTLLLEASIKTTFLIFLFRLIALLCHGGIEYAMGSAVVQKISLFSRNSLTILKRLGFLVDFAVWAVAVAFIMEIWRIYESPFAALDGIFSLGFSFGGGKITLGLAITACLVLYGSFLLSGVFQHLLMHDFLPKHKVEYGSAVSMARLIHYTLILVGFLVAASVLGFDLKNLTILAGAFGIGIGFGLQTIVNNFVSGLILLFERPIKTGDIIQLDGTWGKIKKLGLRATVVETFDQSEIIVPNSDLISGQVTNWTLSDRASRLVVPVGVAYGSDVPLVMKILHETAESNPMILKDPAAQVLFMGFGDSSLDFELRAWVGEIDDRMKARSELHQGIDRRFREADVEIPFPQRDLHVRSVDKEAVFQTSTKDA